MQRQTAGWDLPASDFVHQHVLVPRRVHILVDKELAADLLRIVAHGVEQILVLALHGDCDLRSTGQLLHPGQTAKERPLVPPHGFAILLQQRFAFRAVGDDVRNVRFQLLVGGKARTPGTHDTRVANRFQQLLGSQFVILPTRVGSGSFRCDAIGNRVEVGIRGRASSPSVHECPPLGTPLYNISSWLSGDQGQVPQEAADPPIFPISNVHFRSPAPSPRARPGRGMG